MSTPDENRSAAGSERLRRWSGADLREMTERSLHDQLVRLQAERDRRAEPDRRQVRPAAGARVPVQGSGRR